MRPLDKSFFADIHQMQEKNSQMQEKISQMQEKNSQMQEKNDQQIDKLRKTQEETTRQINKLERTIDKIGSGFNDRWGRLVESLVEGKLSRLLRERGIQVLYTYPNVTREILDKKGEIIERKEFDIIVVNGKEVVLVEVKTTLNRKDVQVFLEQYLKPFKKYFLDHKNRVLYGAVAYLKSMDEAVTFAEEQGLFVIKATGDSAHITNKKTFKPKAFP